MTTTNKSTRRVTPDAATPGRAAAAAPGASAGTEGADAEKKVRDQAVAAKRVATIARNKEASRAEQLAHMASQVSDGSLVIRQMTPSERATDTDRRERR